jgi:DNA repair exonuclease SbcCD nuclease subunit
MIDAIFIGDPHFQVSNLVEVDMFIEKMEQLALDKRPEFIVIGGDLLHTHERLHTLALNKAYELVTKMRDIAPTFVLVGNHDLINNQQFLTENHWMNSMKEWVDVTIVDKVVVEEIDGKTYTFVPYVPNGKFSKALETVGEKEWKNSHCIFAHQEFQGCKMGAIISVDGDEWKEEYPPIISGHIHSRQHVEPNIYYTGSAMQHAFGESEKNIIACLTFDDEPYKVEEVDLCLPRKRIVYTDVKEFDEFKYKKTEDKIRITISGDKDQFKATKKTKKYKDLIEQGVKIVFKTKRSELKTKDDIVSNYSKDADFSTIIASIIKKHDDPYLNQAFDLVVHGKEHEVETMIKFR